MCEVKWLPTLPLAIFSIVIFLNVFSLDCSPMSKYVTRLIIMAILAQQH